MKDSKKVTRGTTSRRIWEMVIFSMLAALMFAGKIAMETLPNIHLVGVLTIIYTVVFRHKALIPIYLYVLMDGVFAGFNMWWVPYLYIWTLLWGAVMLLPPSLPKWARCILYPALCGAHGFLFGILYAPAQAVMFGLDFKGALAWIAAGLPFDAIHGVANICMGLLIYPLSELLTKLSQGRGRT